MASHPAARHEHGFTVLELLVVVAIATLLLAGVVRLAGPVPAGIEARAIAREVATMLRLARGDAIAANRPVGVAVDLAGRRIAIDGRPALLLPPTVELVLHAADDQVAGPTLGRIRFDGDGGSTGGRIGIRVAARTTWVGVDWLSGRVSLAEAP